MLYYNIYKHTKCVFFLIFEADIPPMPINKALNIYFLNEKINNYRSK